MVPAKLLEPSSTGRDPLQNLHLERPHVDRAPWGRGGCVLGPGDDERGRARMGRAADRLRRGVVGP